VVRLEAEPYPGAGEVKSEVEGRLYCDMMILSEDRRITSDSDRF
jgi:hypothetical protein